MLFDKISADCDKLFRFKADSFKGPKRKYSMEKQKMITLQKADYLKHDTFKYINKTSKSNSFSKYLLGNSPILTCFIPKNFNHKMGMAVFQKCFSTVQKPFFRNQDQRNTNMGM